MIGILASIIAGAVMSVQGVFNTRLSEKTGLFESNVIVQAIALAAAMAMMLFFGKGDIKAAAEVNKIYLTGGLFGALITVTVMLGMNNLSPARAVTLILISQLCTAGIIDAFGLFGAERVVFGFKKWLGLAAMLGGVILFKL